MKKLFFLICYLSVDTYAFCYSTGHLNSFLRNLMQKLSISWILENFIFLIAVSNPNTGSTIHPPTHTFVHEEGAYGKLMYIFAPFMCKLQDRWRQFFKCEQAIFYWAQPSSHPSIHPFSALLVCTKKECMPIYYL